jgi:hypothetical protein
MARLSYETALGAKILVAFERLFDSKPSMVEDIL